MKRIDKNDFNPSSREIIAFSCVRNEALRLPYFLDYHRELGVNRFVFIDNDSTDETSDFLISQADCNVFYTKESYAKSNCGINWLNELLNTYGAGHWILTLDADELLIYPQCETVGLDKLTCYLDASGDQALKTFLIDMYSDKPIKNTCYQKGANFLDYCNFFDTDSYNQYDKTNFPIRGGPRHRLFWNDFERKGMSPYLINIPLIKWRKDLKYERGTHVISGLKLSPLVGAKLHFKFFSDFYEYAEAESLRNEHWDNAAQYKSYWDVLAKNSNLNAIYEGSKQYSDSAQVVRLGFMKEPEDYRDYLNKQKNRDKSIISRFIAKFFG